jgi:ABC-type transport system involved in multi-copper enzyme maturation permease subunit
LFLFISRLFTSIASGEALCVADNDGPERDITNISDAIEGANYSSFNEINNFTTSPLDAGNYLFCFAVATIICLHFLVNDVPGLAELCAISGFNPYIENKKDF